MDMETLAKANALEKEIAELERYLDLARTTWKPLRMITRIQLRLRKISRKEIDACSKEFMIRRDAYGAVISHDYPLSKELCDKVFNAMEEHLTQLKKEFAELK